MRTVWKFPFDIGMRLVQEIEMPINAKILSAQIQKGIPCLWAEVETTNPTEYRFIAVYGTGNQILDNKYGKRVYIATIQVYDEVYHVYEILTEE